MLQASGWTVKQPAASSRTRTESSKLRSSIRLLLSMYTAAPNMLCDVPMLIATLLVLCLSRLDVVDVNVCHRHLPAI